MLHNTDITKNSLKANRNFGFTFIAFFLLVAATKLYTHNTKDLQLLLSASALLTVITLSIPNVLGPFNRAWLKFGDILHKITSPVLMAVLFYVVITPMGLLMRAFRADPMKLRYDAASKSYWVTRQKDINASSMINQF